ncbi:uncharacterized protein [Physcomitrium patens]|uniref:Uncharacterized protein n=1 Tax=Physcomitrium patens TaxID=3218 RepID=A9S582_PHYPA|nr:hypothetical protein PHYPA_028346 [Physcomitrium patens]
MGMQSGCESYLVDDHERGSYCTVTTPEGSWLRNPSTLLLTSSVAQCLPSVANVCSTSRVSLTVSVAASHYKSFPKQSPEYHSMRGRLLNFQSFSLLSLGQICRWVPQAHQTRGRFILGLPVKDITVPTCSGYIIVDGPVTGWLLAPGT